MVTSTSTPGSREMEVCKEGVDIRQYGWSREEEGREGRGEGRQTHDLLDNLGRGVKVDESLVDLHLEAVPGLGTLTTGGLSGGDLEDLGGHSDGTLNSEVLVLGSVDEVGRDCIPIQKTACQNLCPSE